MFQSTHSLRSATIGNWPGSLVSQFQSTHSLRSATGPTPTAFPASGVSIHALLAECDPMSEDIYFRHGVSIHALLAECDHFSVRRGRNNHGFNPRTPCGVRPIMRGQADMPILFQSTHSLRSATRSGIFNLVLLIVSIHALLAECDPRLPFCANATSCFNPRTPCGVRLKAHMRPAIDAGSCFNPRTPCGVRRNRLYTLLLNRANHTLRQPP